MSTPAPYGGRRLIADTSAWTALRRARQIGNVPNEWGEAVEADQILTSPVVQIELLHSARNRTQFDEWHQELGYLERVALTDSACRAAVQAMWELSRISGGGYHRVGLGDALVAASAQDASVGVLHYNHRDFDRLAEVLVFDNQPLGAPGEFELPDNSSWLERLSRKVLRKLPPGYRP